MVVGVIKRIFQSLADDFARWIDAEEIRYCSGLVFQFALSVLVEGGSSAEA